MKNQRTMVLADPGELRSVEAEWRMLAERRGNAFLTPEWFWSWLEHYGESAEPVVSATMRPDGTLQGVIPFVLARAGRPRTVRFAGASLADHLHPVCLPEDEEPVAAAAFSALAAIGARWRLAVLDNVDVGARWYEALGRPPFVAQVAFRESSLPAIELSSEGWDGYLASRSRNFRDQARRYPRRLEREHQVSYRMTSNESELGRDMETLFALHDARWTSRGGSTLTSSRARAFHLDFARAALARGWLRLWLLEVDGAAVAAWHGWRVGDTYAYYQAGFDPAWERLSVGFVLLVHTVRSAIEEGASRYDMLLGDERYKGRFANTERSICTVMLSRSQPARLLVGAEAQAWRASRSLPEGLRGSASTIAAMLPGGRRR